MTPSVAPSFGDLASSIAILHDATPAASAETGAAEAAAIESVLGVVADVEAIGWELGLHVERVPLPGELDGLFRAIAGIRAELVVNLAEGWRGIARNEIAMGWLLELSGKPYTGAPPRWSILGTPRCPRPTSRRR